MDPQLVAVDGAAAAGGEVEGAAGYGRAVANGRSYLACRRTTSWAEACGSTTTVVIRHNEEHGQAPGRDGLQATHTQPVSSLFPAQQLMLIILPR